MDIINIYCTLLDVVVVLGLICFIVWICYEIFIKLRRLAAVAPPPVSEMEMP
ncbi:hypothetical protein L195_g033256 [Trifolium pratense]|uniref:Uncharacterized protein n=2 Tax=Trifolium pratense TaxID=57577 RepID=A0A2K3LFH7_TRIPR|nr:hypothetical protein L195_g052982 [Trifolium pratense]PNX77293.1 hypothetical protein L195_g033256 [Trifolium pratense]